MEDTRRSIRVQGKSNPPPEKPPEGARSPQDPEFRNPTIGLEAAVAEITPLLFLLWIRQVSPEKPEMRSIARSPGCGPNEHHTIAGPGTIEADERKEAQLHFAAKIAAARATSLTLKSPPIVPLRFAESVGWSWHGAIQNGGGCHMKESSPRCIRTECHLDGPDVHFLRP
ncbi:hypothetical protein RJZ56_005622 [Blastomyces dermatitidis]